MSIRVLPAPDQGDAPVVITAAELHPDSVVIDYISLVSRERYIPGGAVDREPGKFEVTDDLGTKYEPGWSGRGGPGVGDVLRLSYQFLPAVPDEASYLRVTTGAGTVVIMI